MGRSILHAIKLFPVVCQEALITEFSPPDVVAKEESCPDAIWTKRQLRDTDWVCTKALEFNCFLVICLSSGLRRFTADCENISIIQIDYGFKTQILLICLSFSHDWVKAELWDPQLPSLLSLPISLQGPHCPPRFSKGGQFFSIGL